MGQHDDVAVLTSAANEVEAAVIVACLEAEGVRATTVGAMTSGFRAEVPGFVQVLVAKQNVDRARQILAERGP